MKSRTNNLRGLQSIRTISNRDEQCFSPHKAFMKLAALEMEKVRRLKEKESALARLDALRIRFRAIEAEKAVLLQQLADAHYDISNEAASPAATAVTAASASGFKLKY